MERLKQKRTALRSQVTRLVSDIDAAISSNSDERSFSVLLLRLRSSSVGLTFSFKNTAPKYLIYQQYDTQVRIISHVYESYKVRFKEWELHEQPFVLLSRWSGKLLTKVTASEPRDVVKLDSDTLKTIKRAMNCNHRIEATYIHCLATDVLRYRLIAVDALDSWK
ncbi:hypothetical protein HPB47_007072 [Ixodes persulcatus]|uniref:Uncharacterized protein n=1 Tax=Ixodes persulcatus TaxID=34615 RepID=A0AC60P8N7_IXOPE|nr:hypothetical protein HPB47_007072 [Ixodes persulcatus]